MNKQKQANLTKLKRLSIPINECLYNKIKKISRNEDRSITQQARLFLKQAIEAMPE